MKLGLSFTNRGHYGDIHTMVELAGLAEEAGWDGFFLWDHYASAKEPHVDPWICMAAIASSTQKMRLGLHVTPVSRRRPWKIVRELVSLDHLSNGRMIFGAGLGDFVGKEFEGFGETADRKTRGQMLDEGLEIIAGLQSGEEFSYKGEHYKVGTTTFRPKPVQSPRVPIWIGGKWPNKPPFRRAARWDGAAPVHRTKGKKELFSPEETRQMADYIRKHRKDDQPFDLALSGILPGVSHAVNVSTLKELEKAGATWWLQFVYNGTGTLTQNWERIKAGPPRA
ncbi:LLM class flavin-dependent oxidoreductase [Chloroflexota bacterium]